MQLCNSANICNDAKEREFGPLDGREYGEYTSVSFVAISKILKCMTMFFFRMVYMYVAAYDTNFSGH